MARRTRVPRLWFVPRGSNFSAFGFGRRGKVSVWSMVMPDTYIRNQSQCETSMIRDRRDRRDRLFLARREDAMICAKIIPQLNLDRCDWTVLRRSRAAATLTSALRGIAWKKRYSVESVQVFRCSRSIFVPSIGTPLHVHRTCRYVGC